MTFERGSPDQARRPAVALDEVDKSKLPGGVKVTATARSVSGRIWLLTDQGAFRSTATSFEPLVVGPRQLEPGQPAVDDKPRITALVADQLGHIWVGTDKGIFITNGEEWWHKLDGHDGVPFERINCLHLAKSGDVWAGTPEGAWRLRDGQFRYFWGKRWLLDNDVQAIWTSEAGRVWIETKAGVASIDEKPMTLAWKAARYDQIIQTRHNRRGFIAGIDLETPGDVTKVTAFEASDNDGLWTSLYVGRDGALRFGSDLKDPAAREQARKSMNALLDLERLSGIPGFPARAMVTDEELKAGAHGFNPDAKVHAPGETAKACSIARQRLGASGARAIRAATSSTGTISPGICTTTWRPMKPRRRKSPPSSGA